MLKLQILDILEQDARTKPEDVAVMLNADPEEVARTIKQLEEDNIIAKYTAIINNEKVPGRKPEVEAFIEVQVRPERTRGFDSIAERIYRFPEVKSVYLMSGGYDLLVVIEGKNLQEIASFVYQKLAPLEHVTGTRTHFQLKKYKENNIILAEKEKNERLIVSP